MKKIEIQKGHILQKKGDINTKVYSVEKGLLRSYSIDKKGKEHVFMFAPKGWIVSDSYDLSKPTELFIEALEDSTILVADKETELKKTNPFTLIKRIAVIQKRVIMLMSASAIERYDDFIETYPDIVQRVPQRMIASYLGITPEALSKVKGDKARTKN